MSTEVTSLGIKARGGWALVEVEGRPEKKGVVFLAVEETPTEFARDLVRGKILSVGEGEWEKRGKRWVRAPMDCQAGEIVIFRRHLADEQRLKKYERQVREYELTTQKKLAFVHWTDLLLVEEG